MPVGLRIRDPSGNIIIDWTMRLGRILGVVTLTGPTAGSAVHAEFADGTPFWTVQCISASGAGAPTISVSGTTISWTFGGVWDTQTYRLVYGVY